MTPTTMAANPTTKRDANDVARELGLEGLRAETLRLAAEAPDLAEHSSVDGPKSLRELMHLYPAMRKPVIHGLLREGETMNVIASSKMGKSWLVIDLALAVATGRPWLGMDTVQGDVLVIDNELHGETSASRIPKVAAARGIDYEAVADRLYVENLRGRLTDLFALEPYFEQFEPGRFKVIILDAFYRFLPVKTDENDNATMASLYNYLDLFADQLECCFVLIHHTSKGNQAQKEVTDVGAGAGAQSRATDTHLVLRRHEAKDAVVMDAAVRSWPPIAPRCLRWTFPIWTPADDLDPADLRQDKPRGKPKSDGALVPAAPQAAMKVEECIARFVRTEPRSLARIFEDAQAAGVSERRVRQLLDIAEAEQLVFPWHIGPRRIPGYATVAPHQDEPQREPQDDPKRAMVEDLLESQPELSTRDVAERCGVSRQYVHRIRKEAE